MLEHVFLCSRRSRSAGGSAARSSAATTDRRVDEAISRKNGGGNAAAYDHSERVCCFSFTLWLHLSLLVLSSLYWLLPHYSQWIVILLSFV